MRPTPQLPSVPPRELLVLLSPREREVVALLGRGLTRKEIGVTLFRSRYTINNHVESAMRKLGVSGDTASRVLALWCVRAGLLDPLTFEPTEPA